MSPLSYSVAAALHGAKFTNAIVARCHQLLTNFTFPFSSQHPEFLTDIKFENDVAGCIATPDHSAYEIDFYPNLYLYEHWNSQHYPFRHHVSFNVSADAITSEDLTILRSKFSMSRNAKFAHVQKDVAVLLLCVPPACDHPAIVAELFVPAYLRLIGRVARRLPSAACCVRPLQKHAVDPVAGFHSEIFPILDRWFVPVPQGLPRLQCELDFVKDPFERYFGAPLGPRLTRQRGFDRISQVIFEPRVDAMNAQAGAHLTGCIREDGTYMGIDIVRLFSSRFSHDGDFDALASMKTATVEEFFGLCVPASCDERHVRDFILPRVLPNYFFTSYQYISAVNAMVHRKEIALDFVIAGFPKCGTTSLAYALHTASPYIDLACDVDEEAEDCERPVFSFDPPFAFLWKLSDWKDFNNVFLKQKQTERATLKQESRNNGTDTRRVQESLSGTTSTRRVVRGVKDSRALEKDESLRRVALIDGVKVVVVIRHPIRGYISHYDSVGCSAMVEFKEFASSNLTDCVPGRSWDLWSFRIERLLELVPKHRVLVTTIQEASLDDGFRRIVEFVTTRKDEGLIVDDGSKPWTRRMNVGQGQHVENSALKQTCSSKELLSVLHERFHDEVHRLQRLLAMFGSRTELTFEC